MGARADFDYIVVGSGAGGGPLAANLARAGFQVLVLEAGGDPVAGGGAYDPTVADGPPAPAEQVHAYNYEVPALHTRATRDETFRWDFYVKHYTDPIRQQLDSKYDREHGGIWYPRVGAVGGCTSHNAMITVYPHNGDWDKLAARLGDPSWGSGPMRAYFDRTLAWLGSSTADPLLAVGDPQLLRLVAGAAAETLLSTVPDPLGLIQTLVDRARAGLDMAEPGIKELFDWIDGIIALARKSETLASVGRAIFPAQSIVIDQLRAPLMRLFELFNRHLNPNEMWSQATHDEGLFTVPLAVVGGKRSGVRERLLATSRDPVAGPLLEVRTQALASRVLFEGNVAVGVEYHEGASLYQADPRAAPSPPGGPAKSVYARREVVLAGGTYNTPQLLMLSGVGPRAQLDRFQIPCVVDLEGVGTNLHDRYEVGVIAQVRSPFNLLMGAKFEAPKPGEEAADLAFQEWLKGGGVYTTNGAVLCVIRKSDQARRAGEDPDLFIFGLPGYFKGYFPAYADLVEEDHQHFTWAILKAHTRNRAGTVELATGRPWDRPEINFRYFDEGSPCAEDDLQAVADGVKFALNMIQRAGNVVKVAFITRPGDGGTPVESPIDPHDPTGLEDYIRREAWGHHACGTCRMGPKSADEPVVAGDADPSVLDKDFRVRGTRNLRVVDASIFPDIPGFFIVAAVYMAAEKASDVIIADAPDALARNAALA